jgi:hypothetical protein
MAKVNGGKITSADLVRIDQIIGHLRKVRARLDEIKEDYKKACEPLKGVEGQLEDRIRAFLDATGQEMARTDQGTVSISLRHTASLSDPDEFMTFVEEHGLLELLDRRANATACRAYADEHGELPPGVRVNSIRSISVRAPS